MAGKKFRFSLANVLRLRQYESEQARQELARRLQAREAQVQAVRAAEEALQALLTQPAATSVRGPQHFARQQSAWAAAQRAIDAAHKVLAQRNTDVDQARAELQKRQRTEETLDTLREQEHARYKQEVFQAETAFLDEQAVLGFSRKTL